MRKKGLIVSLFAVLLALTVGWGIGELVVRSSFPYWDLSMSMKFSPSIYARHVISPEEQTVHRRGNPSDTLTINDLGYRGDSVTRPKPSVETRIMIYGGSQVFDANTPDGGWPELVEEQLSESTDLRPEVINAGTPGHATFDSLGRLLSRGHYLEPDIVVLDNTWNDMKYFHLSHPPIPEVRPYDPRKNPRRNYLNGFDRFLGQNSQFYLNARSAYFTWGFDSREDMNFYSEQDHERISEEALRQFQVTVRSFVEVVRAVGATPVLMQQPRLLEGDLTEEQQRKIRYHVLQLTPGAARQAFHKADRILARTARETGVELLTVKDFNGNGSYFLDHVHLTRRGARTLARRVSSKLEALIRNERNASR